MTTTDLWTCLDDPETAGTWDANHGYAEDDNNRADYHDEQAAAWDGKEDGAATWHREQARKHRERGFC